MYAIFFCDIEFVLSLCISVMNQKSYPMLQNDNTSK